MLHSISVAASCYFFHPPPTLSAANSPVNQTLNLGNRLCNTSMFNKQQAFPTKWCKSVSVFTQKVKNNFPSKCSTKTKSLGHDAPILVANFTSHQKNGAQSIKVEFAPAADVWWLLWCWSTCKPVPMNIFARATTHIPNYSSLGHFLNQRGMRDYKV